MVWLQASLLAFASLVRLCAAQASGWDLADGQINTTMCTWTAPRAAVIRDTLYLDGGYLWWQPGMKDGTYGTQIADGNPLGLVYLLNFSTPFNSTTNFSSIFTTISKASGGSGNANNIGPNYVDGGMFANDYEWFTYGGLLQKTDAFPTQEGDLVAAYQANASGPPKQFSPGYIVEHLPDGLTRYVTYGAAASAPSENLGFYFGGLRSSVWGEILQSPGRNASLNADTNSLTLIELDMTTQGSEKWSNLTLPTEVPGRASAEIVWVPVSDQGILVALGGVIYPSYANINRTNNATLNTLSQQQSPGFTKTVSIYDIKTQTWYEQDTEGAPGTLAQGCAVVASAQDGSSHNIYWYGGFDGISPTKPFNDDVWILSVPSFMWMKVNTGNPSNGRAGHRCVKPYPDQMFVIGGYPSLPGDALTCVNDGLIRIFNLSSAEWINSYDPKIWSEYAVPEMIVSMIGGSPTGGATQSAPTPTGFSDAKLGTLFGTKYDTTKIVNWYPYAPSATTNVTRTALPSPTNKPGNGTPKYLAPVLGVVLGLFFITLVILAILLWRRRKFLKSNPSGSQSEAGTMDNRHWVTNWLRSTPPDAKAPTVTTDETPMSPYEEGSWNGMPEVGGTMVHEMMDTSRPVELHDTGFIPLHTNSKNSQNLAASPSVTSHTSRASTVSGYSNPSSPQSPQSARPDSPPLNNVRFLSGVSNVSETDRGHLRGISETSVSDDGLPRGPGRNDGLELRDLPSPIIGAGDGEQRRTLVSPLTPPEGVEREGYISNTSPSLAPSPSTPKDGRRRSNFAEGLD